MSLGPSPAQLKRDSRVHQEAKAQSKRQRPQKGKGLQEYQSRTEGPAKMYPWHHQPSPSNERAKRRKIKRRRGSTRDSKLQRSATAAGGGASARKRPAMAIARKGGPGHPAQEAPRKECACKARSRQRLREATLEEIEAAERRKEERAEEALQALIWEKIYVQATADENRPLPVRSFHKDPARTTRWMHHSDACFARGAQWANAICEGLAKNLIWLSKNGKPETMPSYGSAEERQRSDFQGGSKPRALERGPPGVLITSF